MYFIFLFPNASYRYIKKGREEEEGPAVDLNNDILCGLVKCLGAGEPRSLMNGQFSYLYPFPLPRMDLKVAYIQGWRRVGILAGASGLASLMCLHSTTLTSLSPGKWQ